MLNADDELIKINDIKCCYCGNPVKKVYIKTNIFDTYQCIKCNRNSMVFKDEYDTFSNDKSKQTSLKDNFKS